MQHRLSGVEDNQYCKVGSVYMPVCDVPGETCKPIEGSFCTECEFCDKFC